MADVTCVVTGTEPGAGSSVRMQHGTIVCEATATSVQLAVACGEPCMFTRIFGTTIEPTEHVQKLLADALVAGGVVCTFAQAIARPVRGKPVRLSSGMIVLMESTPRENVRVILPGQATALFQIGLIDLGVTSPDGRTGKFAVFGAPAVERLAATVGVADTAELQRLMRNMG